DDGQAEPGTLLGTLDGERALSERGEHDRDLLRRNTGTVVADGEVLATARCPSDLDRDLAATRRELDSIRQEVQRDLAHRAIVGPEARHVALILLVDGDALVAGAEFDEMAAFLDDVDEMNRLLVELVPAGLDARQVEDLVDEVEEVLAAGMN